MLDKIAILVSSIFLRTFESLYTPPKLFNVSVLYEVIVFLIEVFKELVATFRAFPSAGNGEVVDKEAKYAVIIVGGLVDKAARISW